MDIEKDALFKAAVSEFLSIKDVLRTSAQQREDNVRVFLAHAYALSMAAKRDPTKHDALRLKSRIKIRKDTPHHKQTIRALLSAIGEPAPKGSEHEWSKVLCGLEEAGIAETEEAVVGFLTEPVSVGKRQVRGFERAHAVLRGSERMKNERKSFLEQRKLQRKKQFIDQISTLRDDLLGGIISDGNREFKDDLWISVNEYDDVLRKVNVSENDIRELILKYGVEPLES